MPFPGKQDGIKKKLRIEEYCQAMINSKFFKMVLDGESQRKCFKSIALFLFPKANRRGILRKYENKYKIFYMMNKLEIENYFKTNYNEINIQTNGPVKFPLNKTFKFLGKSAT